MLATVPIGICFAIVQCRRNRKLGQGGGSGDGLSDELDGAVNDAIDQVNTALN